MLKYPIGSSRASARSEANKRYRKTPKGRIADRRQSRKRRLRIKIACLIGYSKDGVPKCSCCGESDLRFLTLDHVNGGGREHKEKTTGGNCSTAYYLFLKKRGFPQNPPLTILCFNCNCGRQVNGGTCPHKDYRTDWLTKVSV